MKLNPGARQGFPDYVLFMPDTGLIAHILNSPARVVELQSALTAVPALGPENGGQGEFKKAALVQGWLQQIGGFDILRVDSPDPRVESGLRPNLIARFRGSTERMLWLFGHLDVVPPGNRDYWSNDPWQVCVRDGYLYGRGVEDNQQAVCSMLLLAESLRATAAAPQLSAGFVFMADEELGSRHGLEWILKARPDLFGKDDLYIVPDGGSQDGSLIEIAEKAQLWLKFTVLGRQCHASMPDSGVNSLVAASRLILALAELNDFFAAVDPLFEPPRSTFVPTKSEANVDAVNILPGWDAFYLDCRLLPSLDAREVIAQCQKICEQVSAATSTEISLEVVQQRSATATPPTSPVVTALTGAIAAVYGVKARPCGIGGATVAAFLRDAGLPAAVWSCIENTCHQPDERSSIMATLKDAAVFARILMRGACA